MSDAYRRQAALLVRLLPLVAEESCFALKGGTAINFFVRDMPRLSVDIDLMYLPVEERPSSLAEIESALKRIGERAVKTIPVTSPHFETVALKGKLSEWRMPRCSVPVEDFVGSHVFTADRLNCVCRRVIGCLCP